ncbi:hypothetical protein F5Y00DRAFT_258133 [Daldinia vernicosa]|uniref:uncharacterized protein n=1 Tax=Daldinia vernicosa TaxID=114800 RepID=UPI002007B6C4|nr:uncharacterized protein F5Y00DRAFT_258133 [Daldinia vernicosa]KAI0852878.1 hypothetical protein F5Y00DRAFT_258133 [Daldinia vernicosa]
MLNMWKVGSKSSSQVPSEKSYIFHPVTLKATRVRACNQCRAKKLKCTKERTGCERCRMFSRQCVYQDSHTTGVPLKIVSPREQVVCLSTSWDESDILEDRHEANRLGSISVDTALYVPFDSRDEYLLVDTIPELTHTPGLDQYETSESSISNVEGIYEPSLDLSQLVSPVWPFAEPDIFASTLKLTDPDDMVIESLMPPNTEPEGVNLNVDVGMKSLCHFEFARSCEEWQYVTNRQTDQTTHPCLCLHAHRITLIIFDLEDIAIRIDNLDSALNINKEALRHGNDMINCEICMTYFENITILTSLIETLGKTCQDISDAYPQLSSTSAPKGTAQLVVPGFILGSYAADSLDELRILVQGLLGLQIQSIHIVSVEEFIQERLF